MDLSNLSQIKQANKDTIEKEQRHKQSIGEAKLDNVKTRETIAKSIHYLTEYLDGHVARAYVTNLPDSIKTPDIKEVSKELKDLHATLKTQPDTTKELDSILDAIKNIPEVDFDVSEVVGGLESLRTAIQAIPAPDKPITPNDYSKELKELKKATESVEKAIKAQKTIIDNKVEAPVVNLDLKPTEKSLGKVETAVKGIKLPVTDTKPIIKEQQKTNKLLNELLDTPMGGGSSGGGQVKATNTDGSAIGSGGTFVSEAFDHVALTYVAAGNGAGEIETAVYKTGGSGGTTVATLTLAYDGNNNISSVTRT